MSLRGVDLPLGSDAGSYQEAITTIKLSSDIKGALITAHKIPVYESAKQLFDVLMPSALEFGEIGYVCKRLHYYRMNLPL